MVTTCATPEWAVLPGEQMSEQEGGTPAAAGPGKGAFCSTAICYLGTTSPGSPLLPAFPRCSFPHRRRPWVGFLPENRRQQFLCPSFPMPGAIWR